jgi:hypothetical protein
LRQFKNFQDFWGFFPAGRTKKSIFGTFSVPQCIFQAGRCPAKKAKKEGNWGKIWREIGGKSDGN